MLREQRHTIYIVGDAASSAQLDYGAIGDSMSGKRGGHALQCAPLQTIMCKYCHETSFDGNVVSGGGRAW